MYPVLFRIGGVEVTSFGVMTAVAAVVGLWLLTRELRRAGLPTSAVDAGVWGLIAGLAGAKLLWTVEHLGEAPVLALLLSRGGLSWFGGFAAGLGTGIWVLVSRRLPLMAVLAAATPALAVGHLIGRIGCFLVGDDYGTPSTLPWAVAFPQGLPPTAVPVHPTQLYEAAALGVIAWLLLRWRRASVPDAAVLGRYLVLAGTARFAIEFLRVNERVLGPFSVAHVAAMALVAAGCLLLNRLALQFLGREVRV